MLLDKLHLINHQYLTNAALLLFSKDPERYFTGAFIKIGFFENNADLLYQIEIRGSLFEQVNKAIELVYFKYMKAKILYEGLQRVEQYFVSKTSMREALMNAVVHKQYESGIPIQISVYRDKLYIGNIGQLPETWTVENLFKKHNSKPYNPNIAHVFYLAGQIESWGRGIEKICSSCKENNLPLPIYHINRTDIMLEFNAPQDLVIDNFRKASGDLNDKLNDTMKAILIQLNIHPTFTTTELSNIIGVSRTSISMAIKKLKNGGYIVRIGNNKKGYWKIMR